jgi:hypothetical protein
MVKLRHFFAPMLCLSCFLARVEPGNNMRRADGVLICAGGGTVNGGPIANCGEAAAHSFVIETKGTAAQSRNNKLPMMPSSGLPTKDPT